MNRYLHLIAFLLPLSFLPACKDKDASNDPAPVTYSSYYPLKPGNYWIYRQYQVDTAGNATASNTIDSVYITKDTLINNKTYYERVSRTYGLQREYLRDSLHYLVNSRGKILFSSQDFTSILDTYHFIEMNNDTIAKVTLRMADPNFALQVPAGSFITSSARQTVNYYPNWDDFTPVDHYNTRYAQGIGIVQQTLGRLIIAPIYIEKRLVRYHVQP